MPGPLSTSRALRRRGVLGLNARNTGFVLPANPRRFYPRVDDKERTKAMAVAAGIPVPSTLEVLRSHRELRDLARRLPSREQFVLKPAHGAQGNGILAVVARDRERFQRARGAWLTLAELAQHASSVISGLFSLRGDPDVCLIEAMVRLHPAFGAVARLGIPDVRVVVYLGVPVMAMCRLPTVASDGRANLHQGAIGAGIDLASGQVVHATHLNRTVIRTEGPSANLKRLTVAVMVDGTYTEPEGGGEPVFTPLGDEQLAALQAVVENAVGFNAARGDRIKIVSVPFRDRPSADTDGGTLASRLPPWAPYAAGAGALAVIGIVWLVMARGKKGRAVAPDVLPVPATVAQLQRVVAQGEAPAPASTPALGGTDGASPPALPEAPEALRARIVEQASSDPERTAEIVRGWMKEAA